MFNRVRHIMGISCLIILLTSTVSYSLHTLGVADAFKEAEIIGLELTPSGGEKDWIEIKNILISVYNLEEWKVVNSIGQVLTLPDLTIQPDEVRRFSAYGFFFACETHIEIRNSADIVVDEVNNVCDTDNGPTAWYKSSNGKWVYTKTQPSTASLSKTDAKISADESIYNENAKICINGENVSPSFPKLVISSGDGSDFLTAFPSVSARNFRECFNAHTTMTTFAYGIWKAELYDLDTPIAATLFAVIPTNYQDQDAGERIKMEQSSSPLSMPCFIASEFLVRDKWYLLVGLISENGTFVYYDFPQLTEKNMRYCLPSGIDADKLAILDPSGIFLVKQYGSEYILNVSDEEILDNEEVCYNASFNPSFVGQLEIRTLALDGSVFTKKEFRSGTYTSLEGCLTPLFHTGQWKLSLVGIVFDEIQGRQQQIGLTYDEFRTVENPSMPKASTEKDKPVLAISLLKKVYDIGEDVTLIGLVNPVIEGQKVFVDILSPDNKIYLTQSTAPRSDGSYELTFTLPTEKSLLGVWTVQANYAGTIKEVRFDARESAGHEDDKGSSGLNGEISDAGNISVAMKVKKKITLLSIKNNDETAVYSLTIKTNDGGIKFVKIKGWDRKKIDASTVLLETADRPMTKGRNMIVILILDNPASSLEWSTHNIENKIVSSGIVSTKPT